MTTETNITTEASSADTNAADLMNALAKREAKNARRRELRAAKKVAGTAETVTVVKATTPKVVADATVTVVKAPSKKERTITIYTEVMNGTGVRKDGIARLTTELGLSPAGASTYWQNCKSGNWS